MSAPLALARGVSWALAIGFAIAVAAGVAAANTGSDSQALALAAAGRCEEALPLLEREADEARSDGLARVRAQCLLHTKRYASAAQLLNELTGESVEDPELALYLGIARFHTADFAGARLALESADSERAETQLYRGLVLLEAGETQAATEALGRAAEIDPERVGPIAALYSAKAWARAGDGERAQEELSAVRRGAPDSVWARRADEVVVGALREEVRERDWWVRLTAGVEWDSNVTLRPDDIARFGDVSDTSDVRGTWRLDVGSELWSDANWSLGARGSFSGNAYRDLEEFDVLYPTGTLWLNRRFGNRMLVRTRYDIGHAWVDGDALFLHQAFTPSLVYVWERFGTSQGFAQLFYYDYDVESQDIPDGPGSAGSACAGSLLFCGPLGVDEQERRDQDGLGVAVGATHIWPLPWADGQLRTSYAYQQSFAEGGESRYGAHSTNLTFRFLLPLGVVLDTGSGYTHRRFAESSTLPDLDTVASGVQYQTLGERRVDHVWQAHVSLDRDFGRYFNVAVRYYYRDNQSNLDPFDYDRSIVGTHFTLALGD